VCWPAGYQAYEWAGPPRAASTEARACSCRLALPIFVLALVGWLSLPSAPRASASSAVLDTAASGAAVDSPCACPGACPCHESRARWPSIYSQAFALVTKGPSAAPSAPSGRRIRHEGGLCLDVEALAPGAAGTLGKCGPKPPPPQQRLRYDGDTGMLVTTEGLCLDAGGDRLHLWRCDRASPWQAWVLDSEGRRVRSRADAHGRDVSGDGGLCLTAVDGTAVARRCDADNAQQEWSLRGGGLQSGGSLCVHMEAPGKAPSFLEVRTCEQHEYRWDYRESDGRILVGRGLCLAAPAPDSPGSRVRVASCKDGDVRQAFRYYASGQIVTEGGGLCVDTSQPHTQGGEVHIWGCSASSAHQRWHILGAQASRGAAPMSSSAPVIEFYMYRAVANGTFGDFPFGNINTGNMAGVMWYLQNEVVTMYSGPMACPRKFNISEIRRVRVRTKATDELNSQGHHFGVRFAYDRGQCVGRCFPGNKCTCTEDCNAHFTKYGYVVGCNKFADHYPFPDMETAHPGGVWYSLPIEGKCDKPTGAHQCTWSWEDAGLVTFAELESMSPGRDQCCKGVCTNFWSDLASEGSGAWRVQKALELFHKKYPHMPPDPNTQWCDFDRAKWYSEDTWVRRDPWNETEGCMRERLDKHVVQPFAA